MPRNLNLLNRRMRTRTSGGVGGEQRDGPAAPYPDSSGHRELPRGGTARFRPWGSDQVMGGPSNSLQDRPPLCLLRRRPCERERSRYHVACAHVRGDHDSVRRHRGALEPEAGRLRAASEEALALPEHDRKDEEAQLIDKIARKQRLEEVARPLRKQRGPVVLFQCADPRDGIGTESAAVPPGERLGRMRRVMRLNCSAIAKCGACGSVMWGQCAAKRS